MILTKDGKILTKDGQILTTGGSVGLYKHYINFYVAGDDYEYAIKLELYLKRKERIQDFATLINCINKQVTYHCLIQDTGDTMYFYSGSIYFETSYLRISFMATDDVSIEKDVDYNVIEDYYNNVEDSVFEILEGTISGASGKEVVEITTPLFKADSLDEANYQTANFDNIDLNNKYVIWDWNIAEYENLDYLQVDKYSWLTMEFVYKQPKNATLLIKMPYFEKITNETYFTIGSDKNFVYLDCREMKQQENMVFEVCRYYEEEHNSLVFYYENFVSGCQFIKIDFDDNGFATIYFYDYFEM